MTDAVCVRFVITGSCHPSYSGRHIQMHVPLTQADGSATTVLQMETQVRSEWPSDLSEMAEQIATVRMKILKSGRVLKDDDVLRAQLTSTELESCAVDPAAPVGTPEEEAARSAVLVHLVFQKEGVGAPSKSEKSPKKGKNSPATGSNNNSTNSNNNSNNNNNNNNNSNDDSVDDSCCTVM